MQAYLVRLRGVTAHFRDPRVNTAKIGLPARTLCCPPPCTVHGLLCAAKGGWVEPDSLQAGWRLDYATICSDFQTSRLPQRKVYAWGLGIQKINISPVEREFLAFPILSILALNGLDCEWFRKPANPLSLGRSEDLVVESTSEQVEVDLLNSGEITRQCLPINIGSGTIYSAPLYFEDERQPVRMEPRIDATVTQEVRSAGGTNDFAYIPTTNETFYVWNFANTR